MTERRQLNYANQIHYGTHQVHTAYKNATTHSKQSHGHFNYSDLYHRQVKSYVESVTKIRVPIKDKIDSQIRMSAGYCLFVFNVHHDQTHWDEVYMNETESDQHRLQDVTQTVRDQSALFKLALRTGSTFL